MNEKDMYLYVLIVVLLCSGSLLGRWISYDIQILSIVWRLGVWWSAMYRLRMYASWPLKDRYRAWGRTLMIAISTVIIVKSLMDYVYVDALVRLIMLASASWASGQSRWPVRRGQESLQSERLAMGRIILVLIGLVMTDRLGIASWWILVGVLWLAWCMVVAYYQYAWHHLWTLKHSLLFLMVSVLRGLSLCWLVGTFVMQIWTHYQQSHIPEKQEVYLILPSSTPTPYLPLPDNEK